MLSVCYILVLWIVAASAKDNRLVQVRGSAHARGFQYGKILAPRIAAIYAHREAVMHSSASAMQVAERFEANWTKAASTAWDLMKKHTPVWFAEMSGMIAAGVPEKTLARLATEYEAEQMLGELKYERVLRNTNFERDAGFLRRPGHCTGVAAFTQNAMLPSDMLITGQTNDEDVPGWLNGSTDVVIHSVEDDTSLKTLYYTHPGTGAYMGMNSAGLTVLWQLIDDGSRTEEYIGVPTYAVLRELLTFHDADEAAKWLCAVPMAIPNNFMLSADGTAGRILRNIEKGAGANACSVMSQSDRGYFAHSNHVVYDRNMADNDIFLPYSRVYEKGQGHETEDRLKAALEGMRRARTSGGVSLATLRAILSSAPVLNIETLASMVFAPSLGLMQIRFFQDGTREDAFRSYYLSQPRGTGSSFGEYVLFE